MSEWKEYYLDEVGLLARGKSKHRPRWDPILYGGDYPFIQTGVVKEANKYISNYTETYSEIGLNQSELWDEGTLCITIAANIAEISFLKFSACFPDSVLGFIADESIADKDFVYYTLIQFQSRLKNLAIGSVQDNINLGTFKKIKFPFPQLATQRKIAAILSSLDDKIENNRKTCEKLEEVASAVFKRWFVDFEFLDKDGKPYKSSGGKMVESELGLIPEGWEEGTLNDIGTIVGGSTPSKKREDFYENGNIPWITPRDLSGYNNVFISNGENYITDEAYNSCSTQMLDKGTVLFTSRAPIGYIAIALNEVCTNQGFKSIVPNKGFGTAYLFELLKTITPDIINVSGGSTFKEISGAGMKNIEVLLPKKTVVEKFESEQKNALELIKNLEQQNLDLQQTRDALLPKLMSGELSVEDVEV